VTSSLALFEVVITVKSTNLIKSYVKTRNRKENMVINNILHKYPSNDRLDIEFTA